MQTSSVDALIDRCLLAPFPGHIPPAWFLRRIEHGLGGVCLFARNVASPDQVTELVTTLRSARPDVVVALDEEGGDVTRLHAAQGSPHAGHATLGAADDVGLTRSVAHAIGAELAAAGIDVDLAPCLDVNSDAGNPVIGVRSFGADPHLVARHGIAFIEGLHDAGVRACVKHFPGHGDTTVDSHLELPTIMVGADVLWERELVPFEAAIAAGVDAVMPSHLLVPALDSAPATVSPRLLGEVLRGELGFAGAVVTDALDMRGIARDGGMPVAAVHALAAGADLCCLGAVADAEDLSAVHHAIAGALAAGRLTEDRLTEAAGRSARLRATAARPTGGFPRADTQATDASCAAARRALRVEGSLPAGLRAPLVVICRPPANIAVGAVPWGPAADILARDPSAETLDAGPETSAASVLATARERPLVVVTREAHRHPWQDALVAALSRSRPGLVEVEMGWPAPRRNADAGWPRLLTFGAARVNATAAAAALAGEVRAWR
ncbi:MAG TPA: beta-N-acetylhexosaminidase [Acidimicrobiales bacterium]|jgi:beta-N-acetylhexosaminidase|nr:beta-N-acetylhexosaminidase [Acidimicrobiales bacterium]